MRSRLDHIDWSVRANANGLKRCAAIPAIPLSPGIGGPITWGGVEAGARRPAASVSGVGTGVGTSVRIAVSPRAQVSVSCTTIDGVGWGLDVENRSERMNQPSEIDQGSG